MEGYATTNKRNKILKIFMRWSEVKVGAKQIGGRIDYYFILPLYIRVISADARLLNYQVYK